MRVCRQDGEITEADRIELEKFVVFARLTGQAVQAGVDLAEATGAIYPDIYGATEEGSEER